MLPRIFRMINTINPTSHGRNFVSKIATRLKAVPRDGVFRLQNGLVMELHMGDYIERSLYFDCFEFLCRKIIVSFLHDNCIFVDIGANVGYYSLLVNAKTKHSRIFSFEPNPETAKKFKRNIELSSAQRIEVFSFALSDRDGVATLYCPMNETHGLTSMRNQGWGNEAYEYSVSTKILDNVLPNDIDHIDLIKIDVERAELFVFLGGSETIKRFKPAIFMELNEKAANNFGYDTLDAVRLLISYNPEYRLKLISRHKVIEITPRDLFAQGIREGNVLLY